MTNAVILSAGQGKRLAPYTDNRPKCLVPVNGKPILEWQLRALADAGIENVTVVTGFGADSVDTFINVCVPEITVQCIFNPFYAVSDNIGTLWIARDFLANDSLLINGDTLLDPRIIRKVCDEATAKISVTVDHKNQYDADDMKVRITDGEVTSIGKTLTEPVDGESIGMLRFIDEGADLLRATLNKIIRKPDGLDLWYLSIIDRLAQQTKIGAVSIKGLPWAEIDFPSDLAGASDIVRQFKFTDLNRIGRIAARDIEK